MPLSILDFSKVDMNLFSVLQMLYSMEQLLVNQQIPTTGIFIAEIDRFRNEVTLMIESQGQRD